MGGGAGANFSSMPGTPVLGQSGYPAAIPVNSPSFQLDNSSIQERNKLISDMLQKSFSQIGKGVGQQTPLPTAKGGIQIPLRGGESTPALDAFLRQNFMGMPSSGVRPPMGLPPAGNMGTLFWDRMQGQENNTFQF
jgi:hypothetical protein